MEGGVRTDRPHPWSPTGIKRVYPRDYLLRVYNTETSVNWSNRVK